MFKNPLSLQMQGLLAALYPSLRQRRKVAKMADDLMIVQKTQLEDRAQMQAEVRAIIVVTADS